jgi:predicted dehydrogenase
MDLTTLEELYRLARKTRKALVPMHTMRSVPALAAIQQRVHEGKIGQPLLSFSQKSYKWGSDRPDFYHTRKTFPGIAAWVGIHAFDWLHWILGDVFSTVQGVEGTAARPDYPACASQAAFILTMQNGGVASVTLDYLQSESAPTHGDERLRIAGTRGVIEMALVESTVTLTSGNQPPQALRLTPQLDLFTQFARSLVGDGPAPLTLSEACRITEIALKAQRAAETGQTVSLRNSPFHA